MILSTAAAYATANAKSNGLDTKKKMRSFSVGNSP